MSKTERKKREGEAEESADEELETVSHDAQGQGYLPSAEPKVVKKLNQKVIKWKQTVAARMALQAQEAEEKSDWQAEARKNLKHFTPDEDTGNLIYSAGGVTVTIEKIEDEKISAKVDSEVSATMKETE